MRILHIIPSLAASNGGPPKVAVETCRELLRRGHHAEIYTTSPDGADLLDGETERRIQVQGVMVTFFPVRFGGYFKISLAMRKALQSHLRAFDLVHINSLYQFPSSAAAYYCRKFKVPYILRPHGTLDPYLYRRHPLRKRIYELLIERRNLANAAALHFTTVEEMELASSLNLRFRAAVVPLGFEPEEPHKTLLHVTSIWPHLHGKTLILFLGRVNFKKGLDILARAFAQVRREHSDVHLVIAGPDNEGYGECVRNWLRNEGVLDSVTFTGMVQGARKAALLQAAAMFVLSSYSENFGIAVVEAMAARVPVVVSDRVNIWREIRNAGAGIVVGLDAQSLANAILSLLSQNDLREAMGHNGARFVRENFSWEIVGDTLIKLYRSVLERQKTVAAIHNCNLKDTPLQDPPF